MSEKHYDKLVNDRNKLIKIGQEVHWNELKQELNELISKRFFCYPIENLIKLVDAHKIYPSYIKGKAANTRHISIGWYNVDKKSSGHIVLITENDPKIIAYIFNKEYDSSGFIGFGMERKTKYDSMFEAYEEICRRVFNEWII